MQCKKCGTTLSDNDKFCTVCGEKNDGVFTDLNQEEVGDVNNSEKLDTIKDGETSVNANVSSNVLPASNATELKVEDNVISNSNSTTQSVQPSKKKSSGLKIALIVGGIFIGFIILIVVIILLTISKLASRTLKDSKQLVCISTRGSITLMYDDSNILGYTANGIKYDLDGQKAIAQKIGVEAYLKEFNEWFVKNTYGKCTIDGKEFNSQNDDKTTTNDNNTNSDLKTVGDSQYGYVKVPNKWVKFYDVSGTTALQYSYANVYIVTLDIVENSSLSAKEVATNYMANKKNSSEVTNVTGATVTIGKNKQYTAYQVYMYYPSDGTYLITYWFEAEDGKIHYLSLEGPSQLNGEKLSDYLYIPESFSLTSY